MEMFAQLHAILTKKLILKVKTNKGQRVTVSVFTGVLTGVICDWYWPQSYLICPERFLKYKQNQLIRKQEQVVCTVHVFISCDSQHLLLHEICWKQASFNL